MKKLLPLILILLILTSCAAPESPPLSEALKISTYVYPKEIADSIDYHDTTVKALEELDASGVALEKLKLGEERLLARADYDSLLNLNFKFEYDGGTIEVISEKKDVQLSVGEKKERWTLKNEYSERQFGYNLHMANSGFMTLAPLGGGSISTYVDEISVFSNIAPRYPGPRGPGTEYYVTINAYEGGNTTTPIITATLLLTQLGTTTREPYYSGFCSAEIISYDYSDVYKIMEAEQ